MNNSFQNVVKAHRSKQGMTVRIFADALNRRLINTSISYATISRWETKDNISPDLNLIFEILFAYSDWRMQFAMDALEAIMPYAFETGLLTFNLSSPKTTQPSAAIQA